MKKVDVTDKEITIYNPEKKDYTLTFYREEQREFVVNIPKDMDYAKILWDVKNSHLLTYEFKEWVQPENPKPSLLKRILKYINEIIEI